MTTKARSILSYFPGTPRPGQRDVLLALEAAWDEADVHVLGLPVAAGKTKIARTIQAWAAGTGRGKAHYAVPNNVLLEQLRAENPRACVLFKKESYRCKSYREEAVMPDASCASHYDTEGRHCADCPYTRTVRAAHGMPSSASNFHTMLAHKLNKGVAIFDEAHLLVPMVREMEASHIWLSSLEARAASALRRVQTYKDLAGWLESADSQAAVARSPVLQGLREQLSLGGVKWLVSRDDKLYRGQYKECLSLLPLDTSHSQKSQHLWPAKKTQKIVLMSATVHAQDVAQLGLGRRRVKFYEAPSAIPAERRPWRYLGARVGSMSAAMQKQNLARCVQALVDITLAAPPGPAAGAGRRKGLVHAPYNLAAQIGPLLRAGLLGKAKVFLHEAGNAKDKQAQLGAWMAYEGDAVLVGSGMEEGLNLLGLEFQWQAIAKVQFPSLEEPAIAWLAEQEPERYAWLTAQKLLQAYGRICRGPEDYGETYILDGAFKKFYATHTELFPQWFREAQAGVV
jgi:Rad3-related DNA helicase